MAHISVAQLLQASTNNQYQFTRVEADREYLASIVEADIADNRFGGQSLTLVLEFLSDDYQGCHMRHFVTVIDKNAKVDQKFFNLMSQFFDLKNLETINTDLLVGKQCKITVADKKNSEWQKVTKFEAVNFSKEVVEA